MELGKVPPHDIEAEQAILGSMLTDKEAIISALEVLKIEDFYREDNKKNPRGETKNVHGVWVTRPRKHRYAYIMDKSLKCLLPECNAPKQNNIVPLECCNDTHKVYDNRFNEYYSCPICTGKLIHINGDIATDIVDALVKQSIAQEHKGNKKLF